jgi:GTPase
MSKLNKESYYGNVEYKQELKDLTSTKIQKYATQLKFRLIEGNGKAIYLLGIKDDGTILGVPYHNIDKYSDIMTNIAKEVDSTVTEIITIGIPYKLSSIIIVKLKANFDMNSIFYFV